MCKKVYSDILPHILCTHYFTRNRTCWSDFPPFFPRMGGPVHRSPKLHVCVSGNGKRIALVRLIGTISREANLFLLAFCLCDWKSCLRV